MPTPPRVVFWDNDPAPYAVERFNAVADRGQLDFSVWFLRRTDPDRRWGADESAWRFNGAYLDDPTAGVGALQRFIAHVDHVRPDLVVSLYGHPPFVLGHAILKAAGVRTALVVERTFDAWVRRRWWKEAAKGILFRSADAAHVHAPPPCSRNGTGACAGGFQYARRYGFPDERMFGVTHSINAELYRTAGCVSAARRQEVRANVGAGHCLFLYVGRYWSGKGIPVLLDAYDRARAVDRNISLLLIGNGPDEASLRRAAARMPGVTLWPFVPMADLLAAYAAADAFVFPTLGDPFGMVVEEAHAAGLPVISSDAAGDIERRVVDGVSGFVVPAGDAAAMAARMLMLAADPGLRRSMGARGAERVSGWSHDSWADDFEQLVASTLALPPRRSVSGRTMAAGGRTVIALADAAARATTWYEKAGASGLLAAGMATIASRLNRVGLWFVSLSWRMRAPRQRLRKFGTEYHGWTLPVEVLNDGGICYSVGVGEDTSFEDDLLRYTPCRIWSFDPTPRAIGHVARQSFDGTRFHFVPVAVWDEPGTLRLFPHPDTACETYSPVNLWDTSAPIDVPCTTVCRLMRELGHDRLLLLKINIGGGEWRVLRSVIDERLEPRMLCVEFCQPASFRRVAQMVETLAGVGYRYCCHVRWKFTFLRVASAHNLSQTSRSV